MRNRYQKGHLYRKCNSWFVRYYDNIRQDDGSIQRVQVSRRVASFEDCRRKADVMHLVEELLRPVNVGLQSPTGSMTLQQFVEEIYLPYVAEQKRASTLKGYRDIWHYHLKDRCGCLRVHEFRTWDGERILQEIARQSSLTRTTLKHIKSVLSAIFKHAKRHGVLDGVNPMQDVSIPRAKEAGETYAYSLEEITRMLMMLPEPAATVVAAAAFTGMRMGELKGLLWENWNGTEIWVTQSVWKTIVNEPKTRKSKAPVPVIPALAKVLERHRAAWGFPTSGLIFVGATGKPLRLENLARRVIRPTIERAGLSWHGWHAFRRGLATNLYRLGISDKTIQAILRHANVSTTMNSYVKSVSADATAAMQALEQICTQYAPSSSSSTERVA